MAIFVREPYLPPNAAAAIAACSAAEPMASAQDGVADDSGEIAAINKLRRANDKNRFLCITGADPFFLLPMRKWSYDALA